VAAVHEHIDDCAACGEVYEEMGRLDRSMCSVTLIGLLVAVVRGWLRFGAPIAATVAKPLASAMVAGAMVAGAITIEPPVRDVDPTEEDESTTNGTSPTPSRWLLVNPFAGATTADGRAASGLAPADEEIDATPYAAPVDDPTQGDELHPNDLTTRPTTPASIDGAVPPPLAPDVADPAIDPGTTGEPNPGVPEPNVPAQNVPAQNDPDPELIDAVDDVLTGTVEATEQLLTGVTGTVTQTVTQVGATANTLVTETVATAGQTLDVVVDDVAEVVETVADTAEDAVEDVTDQVTGVTEPVGELVDDVTTVVQDDVLDDALAPLASPAPPQANPPAGLGETVAELTDGDSVFGVVGGGLVLFGN
jgi:hypothetical protein